LNVTSYVSISSTFIQCTPFWFEYAIIPQKVGAKFRRQVAVDQSVYFVRGLRVTEFVLFVLYAIIKVTIQDYKITIISGWVSSHNKAVNFLYSKRTSNDRIIEVVTILKVAQ
jgi:hypothetical protein